jgi:hypothetical protein
VFVSERRTAACGRSSPYQSRIDTRLLRAGCARF